VVDAGRTEEGFGVRLIAWNTRGGLTEAHRAALAELRPDVAVLSEVQADPTLTGAQGPKAWLPGDTGTAKRWGVASFGDLPLEGLDPKAEAPWAVPVQVGGPVPFLLLAVWTVRRPGDPPYEEQVRRIIDAYEPEIAEGPVVLAGDLNSCEEVEPKRVRRHLANVRRLAGLGLVSAYQHVHGDGPLPPTLRWQGRYFHCDFVFVPELWLPRLSSAEVGAQERWIDAGLSDHAPVIVELDLARPT
jgi:hypothetical protein